MGDITVLAGALTEPPIGPGTDRVHVVIDFIRATVSGMRLGNLRTSCASATRTRYDGMFHPYTAGSLESVVAIGTAAKTTTVLRATFCYLRNDRVVIGRGHVIVSRITILRDHTGSALCRAVGGGATGIPFSATTAATFAHLQYNASHCTELFPFRGCKVAVGVGDNNIIYVCECTSIVLTTSAVTATGAAITSLA